MNYKVGDRVRIKSFEDIRATYLETAQNKIDYFINFVKNKVNKCCPDKIVTIKEIIKHKNYKMEETGSMLWGDDMIEKLVKEQEPTTSRWEILDL